MQEEKDKETPEQVLISEAAFGEVNEEPEAVEMRENRNKTGCLEG